MNPQEDRTAGSHKPVSIEFLILVRIGKQDIHIALRPKDPEGPKIPTTCPTLPGQQKIHEFHVEARPIVFIATKNHYTPKSQKYLRVPGWFTRRAITTQLMIADLT